MWPFIVAALIIAALAGGTVAAIAIFGKDAKKAKVTLLGPRRAGKTTLGRFLQDGTITREYAETRTSEVFEGPIKLEDLELQVVMSAPGGSEHQYGEWQALVKDARVVVYLFDVTRIAPAEQHGRLAIEGAKQFRLMRKNGHTRDSVKVVLVGTHRDEDTDPWSPSYEATLVGDPVVAELTRILRPDKTEFVSLMDAAAAQSVLWEIATQAGRK